MQESSDDDSTYKQYLKSINQKANEKKMKFKFNDYKPTLNENINKSKNSLTMNSNNNLNSNFNYNKKFKEDDKNMIDGKISLLINIK